VGGFVDAGYSNAEAYIFANVVFFCGIAITMVLDICVHKLMAGQQVPGHDDHHGHDDLPKVAGKKEDEPADVEFGVRLSDLQFENENLKRQLRGEPPLEGRGHPQGTSDAELKQMGLITGLAIALHNFPEGLATFVATLSDARLGVAVAFAIALHNIPEGLCVAMPLYYSTGSRLQGFLWAFASGLSEPLGGLLGYIILAGSDMHPMAYGIVFAIVGGMMVYISFQELIPTALRYDPANSVTVKAVFVGMAVMDLSLVLFQI
jgi:zinc transporter ZupT